MGSKALRHWIKEASVPGHCGLAGNSRISLGQTPVATYLLSTRTNDGINLHDPVLLPIESTMLCPYRAYGRASFVDRSLRHKRSDKACQLVGHILENLRTVAFPKLITDVWSARDAVFGANVVPR